MEHKPQDYFEQTIVSIHQITNLDLFIFTQTYIK